jgi:hypothetical protein
MADTNTKNVIRCCSNCNVNKEIIEFRIGRSKCNACAVADRKLKYNNDKEYRDRCNEKRRNKYNTNDDFRKKAIQDACSFKHNKVLIKQQLKLEQELQIGLENKLCKYCNTVKLKDRFRFNRLKCRDCERDEPVDKFKRVIRSRIYLSLKKDKKTIEYLGCNSNEYIQWILSNNNNYTLENHGTEWHIDHVIPLSKFDLNDECEQYIAFNWRNTMPLSRKENLSKNNKIIHSQVKQHYHNLLEYHKTNNIILPEKFINLFAKHLDAGSPLEPLLPLSIGNNQEELG